MDFDATEIVTLDLVHPRILFVIPIICLLLLIPSLDVILENNTDSFRNRLNAMFCISKEGNSLQNRFPFLTGLRLQIDVRLDAVASEYEVTALPGSIECHEQRSVVLVAMR